MTPACRKVVAHVERLGLAGDRPIPADVRIDRTYAGHWQRSQGAFSWFLHSDSDPHHPINRIGSVWTARVVGGCEDAIADECYTDVILNPCQRCIGYLRDQPNGFQRYLQRRQKAR